MRSTNRIFFASTTPSTSLSRRSSSIPRPPQKSKSFPVKRTVTAAVAALGGLILGPSSCTQVQPGHQGVRVTLGKVDPESVGSGLVWHKPFITSVEPVSLKVHTNDMPADCFSQDLQELKMKVTVLWKTPANSAVQIYQKYSGEPFDKLVAPRVQEALKEVTALHSAEVIVKKREDIKTAALGLARAKIGNILEIVDVVLENIDLSAPLEHAIETKMVQAQEAAKARFAQDQAGIEARTATINALGESGAIAIQGLALRENPSVLEFTIAEAWNGKLPQVVGGSQGTNILLPLQMTSTDQKRQTIDQVRAALQALRDAYFKRIDEEAKKLGDPTEKEMPAPTK